MHIFEGEMVEMAGKASWALLDRLESRVPQGWRENRVHQGQRDSLDMVLTSRFQVPQVLGDSKALVGALGARGPKGPKVIKGRMGLVLLE